MTAATDRPVALARPQDDVSRATRKQRRVGAYVFLTIAAIFWITPVLWTLYTALRPVSDTDAH